MTGILSAELEAAIVNVEQHPLQDGAFMDLATDLFLAGRRADNRDAYDAIFERLAEVLRQNPKDLAVYLNLAVFAWAVQQWAIAEDFAGTAFARGEKSLDLRKRTLAYGIYESAKERRTHEVSTQGDVSCNPLAQAGQEVGIEHLTL